MPTRNTCLMMVFVLLVATMFVFAEEPHKHHNEHKHMHDSEHHHDGHEHHHHHNNKATEHYSDTTRWYFALLSALFVSLLSFSGAIFLVLGISKSQHQQTVKLFLSALAVGSLIGDTCFHLIPTIYGAHSHGEEHSHAAHSHDSHNHGPNYGLYIVIGFFICFVLELYLRLKNENGKHNHSHGHSHSTGIKPFGWLNLFGDGMSMGSTYHNSFKLGVANTLCIVFHEIPQELSDFGVLLSAGFSMGNALLFNFLSGLVCVVGCIVARFIVGATTVDNNILLALTAGSFIYIAAADMIPELWTQLEEHVEKSKKKELGSSVLMPLVWIILGIFAGLSVMIVIGEVEHAILHIMQ